MFSWNIKALACVQFHRFRLHYIKKKKRWHIIFWPDIWSLCHKQRTQVHRLALRVRIAHSHRGDVLTPLNFPCHCFCFCEPCVKSQMPLLPWTCFVLFSLSILPHSCHLESRLSSSLYCMNPAHHHPPPPRPEVSPPVLIVAPAQTSRLQI